MDTLPAIGIREFRENLHKYTAATTEPFAVTSHGRAIGYYIPARPTPTQADFEALRNATAKLHGLMQEIGLTEDEAVAEFERLRKQDRQTPTP
jgi:antitoxin (DNA-binding transcriptional repressor) of toxin-antitoxin stability system